MSPGATMPVRETRSRTALARAWMPGRTRITEETALPPTLAVSVSPIVEGPPVVGASSLTESRDTASPGSSMADSASSAAPVPAAM